MDESIEPEVLRASLARYDPTKWSHILAATRTVLDRSESKIVGEKLKLRKHFKEDNTLVIIQIEVSISYLINNLKAFWTSIL